MQETPVQVLGQEDALEKEQATHSSSLGFPCGSASKESICKTGGLGSILGWKDPLDKGTTLHPSILVFWPGVAKSQRGLNNFHFFLERRSLPGFLIQTFISLGTTSFRDSFSFEVLNECKCFYFSKQREIFFPSFSSLFLSSFPFSFLFGLKIPSVVSLIRSMCRYCHPFILIASQISRDAGLRDFVLYLSTLPSFHLLVSLEFLTINNMSMRTPLVFHLITARQILQLMRDI